MAEYVSDEGAKRLGLPGNVVVEAVLGCGCPWLLAEGDCECPMGDSDWCECRHYMESMDTPVQRWMMALVSERRGRDGVQGA